MRIKKIQFKNIKSFGNKLEEITFSDNPELILLTGTNGVGKSTIQESIDLTIFGQIRGKNKKKIPLKHIPNRFNKNLHTNIEFFNFNNDSVKIQRELLPTTFTISKNGEDITEQYKNYSKEEIEKLVDFNYDTFKSFISLSMNDFLNFIELSTDNKKLLLNKLFNLEKLDDYLSLTKELKTQNTKELNTIKSKLTNNNLNINEYKNLAVSISKNSKNIQHDLKIVIESKKKEYILLQTKLKEISTIISDNNEHVEKINNSIRLLEGENVVRRTNLNNLNSKLEIYEKGICPHCDSDLSKTKNDILTILLSDKKELMLLINNNLKLINSYKNQISELINNNLIKEKKEILNSLNSLKEEIIGLTSDYKNSKNKNDNYS
jgi:exonuclease SbcC